MENESRDSHEESSGEKRRGEKRNTVYEEIENKVGEEVGLEDL